MNDTKEKILKEFNEIIDATEISLNEWSGEGNLQIPVLLGMVAIQLNFDEKQVRRADPIVREYVRSHPDWHITRGAKGGIMKTSERQKKEDAKLAKDLAKKQMQEALEAKATSLVGDKVSISEIKIDDIEISENEEV